MFNPHKEYTTHKGGELVVYVKIVHQSIKSLIIKFLKHENHK